MHRKALLADDWLLVGSSNWTRASSANVEHNVKVRLEAVELRKFVAAFDDRWDQASAVEAALERSSSSATSAAETRRLALARRVARAP